MIALALAPPAAFAHHSAIRFDLTIRDNMVSGIVKESSLQTRTRRSCSRSPTRRARATSSTKAIAATPLVAAGWREGMVKVGDKITLIAAPTRDGSDGGYALGVIAADGTRF